MTRPAPPGQDPEDGAPARSSRLSSILEGPARRMKTAPWASELLEVEGGIEVLVQEAIGLDSQGAPSLCRAWLHPRAQSEMGVSEEDLDGSWLPDVLAIKGVPAAEGEDLVEAEMPTPNIKRVLSIPDGVPVLQGSEPSLLAGAGAGESSGRQLRLLPEAGWNLPGHVLEEHLPLGGKGPGGAGRSQFQP